MTPTCAPSSARRMRGLSMVELLVGAALGLFVAAAAASLLVGQLRENRALILESRLMQDLRTAADLVTRDVRRAGYWGAAASGVWATGASGVLANPYAADAPGAAASGPVTLQYSRDTHENNLVDSNERFGFRLRSGAIEVQLGGASWQALTDATLLEVTQFDATTTLGEVDLAGFCARPCTGIDCPRQQVRSLSLRIGARSVADPQIARTLRSEVRLRNDAVVGSCPGA